MGRAPDRTVKIVRLLGGVEAALTAMTAEVATVAATVAMALVEGVEVASKSLQITREVLPTRSTPPSHKLQQSSVKKVMMEVVRSAALAAPLLQRHATSQPRRGGEQPAHALAILPQEAAAAHELIAEQVQELRAEHDGGHAKRALELAKMHQKYGVSACPTTVRRAQRQRRRDEDDRRRIVRIYI